jgi:succinate dehydrogenase / fumarate reductase flavoprotein subunit
MPDYETFDYDVLVIGAGGAGLRAAIEASAAGIRVGLVCKSLLGKAHTVMAEGGIAAALANVDERDNWKVHFADTMRGGYQRCKSTRRQFAVRSVGIRETSR